MAVRASRYIINEAEQSAKNEDKEKGAKQDEVCPLLVPYSLCSFLACCFGFLLGPLMLVRMGSFHGDRGLCNAS